jgi:hypothetical protein
MKGKNQVTFNLNKWFSAAQDAMDQLVNPGHNLG